MNYYNIFGLINTLFISISVIGIFSQLKTIWQRRHASKGLQAPTELLSLNQFTVSFLAYLSFFIYGYSIEPFNHYIVWPRLIACIIVLGILLEIYSDRRTWNAKLITGVAISALVIALSGLFFGPTITDHGRFISTTLILIISVLIAQGYFHQIRLIISSGSTGAVDLKMSQFILMMDISTIAFAVSMGIQNGWPLMVLAISSGVTKIIIMYLFRWVQYSPEARARRELSGSQL